MFASVHGEAFTLFKVSDVLLSKGIKQTKITRPQLNITSLIWFKHILLVSTKGLGVSKLRRKPSPSLFICHLLMCSWMCYCGLSTIICFYFLIFKSCLCADPSFMMRSDILHGISVFIVHSDWRIACCLQSFTPFITT